MVGVDGRGGGARHVHPQEGILFRVVGMLSQPVFGRLEPLRYAPQVAVIAGRRYFHEAG